MVGKRKRRKKNIWNIMRKEDVDLHITYNNEQSKCSTMNKKKEKKKFWSRKGRKKNFHPPGKCFLSSLLSRIWWNPSFEQCVIFYDREEKNSFFATIKEENECELLSSPLFYRYSLSTLFISSSINHFKPFKSERIIQRACEINVFFLCCYTFSDFVKNYHVSTFLITA